MGGGGHLRRLLWQFHDRAHPRQPGLPIPLFGCLAVHDADRQPSSRKPRPLGIKDDEYAWLGDYIAPGPDAIATVLICTTMLNGYKRTNAYWQRMNRAYRDQFPRLHAATSEKVARALDSFTVASYSAEDVVEFLRRIPADGAVISFPPTYKGGYERLYKSIDAVFAWQPPTYEMFSDERLDLMLDLIVRRPYWLVARDKPIDRLEPYYMGFLKSSMREQHPFWVYGTPAPHKRLVMPTIDVEQLRWPRWTDEHEITSDSKLRIAPITVGQLNLIRSEYMNPAIAPATPSLRWAVLVDDLVIGIIGISASTMGQFNGEWCDAYLMADLALPSNRYPRLSKLVLAAAVTREIRLHAERLIKGRVRTIGTTAFTEKAVSMKYRGLFEVYSRKKAAINYVGTAGRWTLDGALAWWLDRPPVKPPKKRRRLEPRERPNE